MIEDREERERLTAAVSESRHEVDRTLERKYASDDLLVPPVVELAKLKLNGQLIEGLRWSYKRGMDERRRDQELRARLRERPSVDAVRDFWNPVRIPPSTGLLESFLKLGEPDADPADILRYARRWGVLGICRKHRLPGSHKTDFALSYCRPRCWNEDAAAGWEPIESWRHYAQIARSVVIVSRHLRKGEVLPWKDAALRPLGRHLSTRQILTGRFKWADALASRQPKTLDEGVEMLANVLKERMAGKPPAIWGTKLEPLDLWQAVADAVNEWLALGAVRPWLLLERDLGKSRGHARARKLPLLPRLVFAPEFRGVLAPTFPLFGTLGIQLAYVTISERGLFRCVSCGRWDEPTDGRQKYCKRDGCGNAARNRAAAAMHRAKARLRKQVSDVHH